MDLATLLGCKFSVGMIENTGKFLVTYADGTADILTRSEVNDLYGSIMKQKGGMLDSQERIQTAINEVSESGQGTDFFDGESHEPPDRAGKKSHFPTDI